MAGGLRAIHYVIVMMIVVVMIMTLMMMMMLMTTRMVMTTTMMMIMFTHWLVSLKNLARGYNKSSTQASRWPQLRNKSVHISQNTQVRMGTATNELWRMSHPVSRATQTCLHSLLDEVVERRYARSGTKARPQASREELPRLQLFYYASFQNA